MSDAKPWSDDDLATFRCLGPDADKARWLATVDALKRELAEAKREEEEATSDASQLSTQLSAALTRALEAEAKDVRSQLTIGLWKGRTESALDLSGQSMVELTAARTKLAEAERERDEAKQELSNVGHELEAVCMNWDACMKGAAEREAELRELKASDRPWPLVDVLNKLADAADTLLRKHDYDGHGWEEVGRCRDEARIIAAVIIAAPPSPDASQRLACVCGHAKSDHARRDGVLACTVAGCACGPGCIHEGFVSADGTMLPDEKPSAAPIADGTWPCSMCDGAPHPKGLSHSQAMARKDRDAAPIAEGKPAWMSAGINLNPKHYETYPPESKQPAAKAGPPECRCAAIQAGYPARHFKGCPLRVEKTSEPREARATAQPPVSVGPEAGQRDPPSPTRGVDGAPSEGPSLSRDAKSGPPARVTLYTVKGDPSQLFIYGDKEGDPSVEYTRSDLASEPARLLSELVAKYRAIRPLSGDEYEQRRALGIVVSRAVAYLVRSVKR